MGAQAAVLADVGRRLSAAGVRALVIGDPPDLPHVELLAARGAAALDAAPWRWRTGGDGGWRLAGRRRYAFDGGFLVTLHRTLPTAPLPEPAVRRLVRELWLGALPGEDGLLRPRPEPRLVALALQVARGVLRAPAQLDEVHACAARVRDWNAVWALADATGVAGALHALAPGHGRPTARGGGPRAAVWRGTRLLRDRGGSRSAVQALLREPWRSASTRCRFDGLELLAGAGTFLPRAVSEELVRAAVPHLDGDDLRIADVGTGCGAVALALGHRLPGAEVLGVDVDEGALGWARRNAERLGTSRVRFAAGSLLDPLPRAWHGRVAAITANVPCVPAESFEVNADAPPIAYVGADADGLGLQRMMAEQARSALRPGGWLLVQLAPDQWPAYRTALEALGYGELSAEGTRVAVVGAARWPGASEAGA